MQTSCQYVVAREETAGGSDGRRVLISGRSMELRLWQRDPSGEMIATPDIDHDHLGYVQAGALIVRIGGKRPVELHAGDSYIVPAGARCLFEVLEPTTIVEAVGPI